MAWFDLLLLADEAVTSCVLVADAVSRGAWGINMIPKPLWSMDMDLPETKHHELSAVAICRDAVAIFIAEWRRILLWAMVPLLAVLCLHVTNPMPEDAKDPYAAANLLSVGLWYMSSVLWIPASIKVYRFVVLDEVMSDSYLGVMFSALSWKYAVKNIAVYLQAAGVWCLVMLIMFVFVWSVPESLMERGGHDMFRGHNFQTVRMLVTFCKVFMLTAKRMALISADVAVGGVGSLARLGRRAAPYYWLILRTIALWWGVACAPWVIDFLCRKLGWVENATILQVQSTAIAVLYSLCQLAWLVAAGLLYKRISGGWLELDSAEARAIEDRRRGVASNVVP